MWFNSDPQGVDVTLTLYITSSPGFVFNNDGATNDGSLALFISDDPTSKTQFAAFNGVFSNPTLDPTYTQLTFTNTDTGGGLYYYQLNVLDPNGVLVTWDPIIVNQP